MTEAKKRRIQANLRTLDYLEGTGVISGHRRRLVDEVFLFLGAGGTGSKMLCAIRNRLRQKVSPEELEEKTAFLAVDTARKELDELERERGFDSTEVLPIPFEGFLDPAGLSPQVKAWLPPELYDEMGGMGTPDQDETDFCAAYRSSRQLVRAGLGRPDIIASLAGHLTAALKRLLAGKPAGVRLNVFLLTGLAGNTGSGIAVDLAFLTRQIIFNLSEDRYRHTTVSAFLMLPSACGHAPDPAREKLWNHRACAALKEIDYFMGLQSRGEVFRRQYGAFEVKIRENIFDFCTLAEGADDSGAPFSDPAETARNVVADSIVDLLSAAEYRGRQLPLSVVFLPHTDIRVVEAANRRDVNCCYNIISYASCGVPVDLMAAYMASKVLDKVWERLERCGEADAEAAEQFLLDANLSPKEVRAAQDMNRLRERFVAHADEVFRSKGPYYMVNLMYEIHRVLYADGKFASYAASKVKGIFGTNVDWARTERRYNELDQKVVLPMGTGLYEVYSFVVRELQRLLKKNAGLLTDTAVRDYLDELVSAAEIERKAGRFLNLLYSRKDEWTQLDPTQRGEEAVFDAAGLVRDFIRAEFDQLAGATMEDILVKLCTGSKDTEVPTQPPDRDPDGHKPLEAVAEALVSQLSMKARPLVRTWEGFSLDDCFCSSYLTVPDSCKWLGRHIERYAASCGGVKQGGVYPSSAWEEIALLRIYRGVPAWALSWVEQVEEEYESELHRAGFPMEHSGSGSDWSSLAAQLNQFTRFRSPDQADDT